MVPVELQRLAGLQRACSFVTEGQLGLVCRRLNLDPRRGRGRGPLREWLPNQAFRRPALAPSLVEALTPFLVPTWRPGTRLEPDQVLALLRRSRRKGLALGLMWGLGEVIDHPAWNAVWNEWLKQSVEWRRRLQPYVQMIQGAETMEVAQSMVRDAEARRDRMRAALMAMAEACRREIDRLRAELDDLRATNSRLALLQPLRGTRILILGDPSHADGYRELAARYGGQATFADGSSRQQVRAALEGRYDAIVVVTAYGFHTTQMMVQKYARQVPLFFANRGGLGEMERVLITQVAPSLSKRPQGAGEPASA
ncbi:MAG TPA: hypothetical protein VIL38_00715 [Thermaerobacter sp.]